MKNNKLFVTFLAIFIAFSAYSHDYKFTSFDFVKSNELEMVFKEPTEAQESRLVLVINHLLASSIDYPLEARENGNQGMVRGVIYLSPDKSKTSIHFAKGNQKVLETALFEAYNKLNILRFVSEDYEGRRVIPIKIKFELE